MMDVGIAVTTHCTRGISDKATTTLNQGSRVSYLSLLPEICLELADLAVPHGCDSATPCEIEAVNYRAADQLHIPTQASISLGCSSASLNRLGTLKRGNGQPAILVLRYSGWLFRDIP